MIKMIQVQTKLKIVDNSGGLYGQCIRVLGGGNQGTLGDEIVISIKQLRKQTESSVKRGEVHRAVIVRTKKALRRSDGTRIQFDENAIVLVSKTKEPIGNRITGPIPKELRDKGWNKLINLGKYII